MVNQNIVNNIWKLILVNQNVKKIVNQNNGKNRLICSELGVTYDFFLNNFPLKIWGPIIQFIGPL